MSSSSLRPSARSGRRVAVLLRSGTLVAVAGLVVVLTGPAAWSAATVLPAPKAPVAQPVAAEGMQPYVPQTSCDPVIKPGVKKFRDLMLATYARGYDGGATRACAGAGVSEHVEGRAWDFMLSAGDAQDKKVADTLIAWLLQKGPDGAPALEARRLGVMYVMYNHRIWGTWSGQWKAIKPGSDQHTSHIHFSFSWAGAQGRTSFWTGKVAAFDYGPCAVYAGQPAVIYTRANPKPCPTKLPVAPRSTHKLAWTGTGGADVARAQVLLKVPIAARTTTFGTMLRAAVVGYQKVARLPVTGALDAATWVRLDPASKVGPAPTPKPTPAPKPTPTPTPSPTTSSGNASAPAAAWTTVKFGMSGAKVVAVQKALNMAPANRTGYFGSITLAAVKAFQKAHGLAADGVVGPLTARALHLVA